MFDNPDSIRIETLAALFALPAAGLYYSGYGPDGFSFCAASPGKSFIVILLIIVVVVMLFQLHDVIYPPRTDVSAWFMLGVILVAAIMVAASGAWMRGARLLQLARCG